MPLAFLSHDTAILVAYLASGGISTKECSVTGFLQWKSLWSKCAIE